MMHSTNFRTALSVLLAVALLGAGCASNVQKLPKLAPTPAGVYLLGPGDTLQVTVFGEPDLSGTLKVTDSGTVVMPLIGTVPAAGLSVQDLQKKLTALLDAKAVKSPNVTVQINEYRPFFILGEVKNPGSYAYVPDMTVLTAVAIAGGYTFRAAQDSVSVTRRVDGASRESQAARDSRVLPGDVVYVYERHF
ncbi:MAG: polysaccharide export protein [Steroidobacteraceae bacterium]|nr:polysaccharide export protein [Steroidobacteraceae bacterium]